MTDLIEQHSTTTLEENPINEKKARAKETTMAKKLYWAKLKIIFIYLLTI